MDGAAAFQQLDPIQTSISDDVKYWAEDSFRRKQQESIKKNRSLQAAAEEKKARKERISKYSKGLKNYDTGSTSLNELNGRLIAESAEEIGRLAVELENPDLGIEERVRLQTKMSTLQNMPENLQAFTSTLTQRDQEIQKMFSEGKIKNDDKYKRYQDTFQGGFKNYQGFIDENGMPGLVYRDLNGDGIMDAEGYESISQGFSAFTFNKNFDMRALATGIAERVGQNKDKLQEGFTTTETIGPNQEALDFEVYSTLIDRQGDLTEVGESFLSDLGLKDSIKNRETMVQEFYKMVNGQIDRSSSTTTDQSAMTSRMRENRLQRSEDSPQAPNNSEAIPVSEEVWGDSEFFDEIDTGRVNSVGGGGVVLEAPRDADGQIYNNAKVLNYTYDKKGKLLLDIEYVDETRQVSKSGSGRRGQDQTTTTTEDVAKRKVIKVTPEDAREFASKKGMTIDELKQSAQKAGGKRVYKGMDENGNAIFETEGE